MRPWGCGGDTVGFVQVNTPGFFLTDCAAMHLGATCFSVYNTSSPEQIEYVVADAANRVIVTEPQFLDRVLEVRERVDTLEHVVVIGGAAPAGTISTEELEAMGDPGFDFEAAWRAVEPDDVLCLIYTSGTTGPPKGVQLTHDNLVSGWRAANAVYSPTPEIRQISYLPSAHVADRYSCLYAQMVFGGCTHCCPDVRQMIAYSIEVRPTVWAGVPRVFEKLKAALEIGVTVETDAEKRKATEWALEIGRRWVAAYMAGEIPAKLQANGTRPTRSSSRRSAPCSASTRSSSSASAPPPPHPR